MTTIIDSGSITGHVVEVDADAHIATLELLDTDRTRIPVAQVYGVVLDVLTRCAESGDRVEVYGAVEHDMEAWRRLRIFAGYARVRQKSSAAKLFKAMADALPDDYDADEHMKLIREMRGRDTP